MNEVTKMVIAAAFRKMFTNGYLSISTVDECLKLAGILPPTQSYQLLRALHCVHFNEMPRELAAKIPGLLTDCFNGISIDDLMKACEPATGLLGGDRKKLN